VLPVCNWQSRTHSIVSGERHAELVPHLSVATGSSFTGKLDRHGGCRSLQSAAVPIPERKPRFRVVLIEHGYATTQYERNIIEAAGGEFIDAEELALAEALALCETADGVMFRRLDITAEIIRRLRRCKIICRYGVGTDNVDVRAATEANIIVGHVPVYCVDEVSTHALALLLACVRKVVATHRRMERGAWDVHRDDPIFRLAGKTIGLVGFGNIGRAVARKLQGWDLRLLVNDPFAGMQGTNVPGVTFVDFETLCRESDFLSLHCPLLPETHHLINARALYVMKPGAILINTARGPVVDSRALLEALDGGRLAQAGVDVFEEEPLPADSPLRNHPKITISDHTAWYSEESQIDLQRIAAEEVARVCSGGLPRSLANPEVLHRLGRFQEWTPGENMRWQLKRLERLAPT
jgi:D-3-phosphoglycerate dehydrogenase / 2-oxoglutarate reductase